ncbi:uncharacterized protein LOC141674559 [Apium graveolens]|uniref:uncharacterized protein LOC141674559 n=1 Tax=Apium graveolens TaxID=4045 RepID=UPI003D79753D
MATSPNHQEEETQTQDQEQNQDTPMMNRLFQLLQQPSAPKVEVKDGKKAQYASYYLKDEASYWWESSKALLEGKYITWEKFTEMFLEKYLPTYMQDQLEMRFLNHRQEDMTVAEYEVKFSELIRFASEYVKTGAKKAKRFQQGLKPGIRSQVALLEIRNYTALVQKAMIVEGEREVLGHTIL